MAARASTQGGEGGPDAPVQASDLMDVVRLLPDVLFRCYKGDDGKIYWSLNEGGLAEQFGLTTKQIVGKSLHELFPGGASPELEEHFEAAFRGESTIFTNEIAGRHFRHFPKPVVGPDGKVKEVVGFIAEVTELVEAERRLAQANQDLESFVRSVSHDLRNPLVALSNLLHVVRSQGDAGDATTRNATLDRMAGIVERLEGTIEGLLRLSRASRAPIQTTAVDVTAMAKDVVATLQDKDPDRHVTVQIDPGLRANADPELLRTVLENLIGNAWKYSAKTPDARIHVYADGDAIVVEDNGAGFDEAQAARLFAPFERLHGAEFDGHGIGLSIVHRIIERHGGTIEAEGRPSKGARFRFTTGPPPAGAAPPAPGAPPDGPPGDAA
jgi:PAS domain S-box-containing protein